MPNRLQDQEAALRRVVDLFYSRVRQDPMLGPVFNDAVGDWPEHLDKLGDFWSSVMLTTGKYKGNPLAAHLRHLDRITPDMFARWLELWRDTSAELLPPQAAEEIQSKAHRIARSLQQGMFYRFAGPAPEASGRAQGAGG